MNDLLITTLAAAVPLYIMDLHELPEAEHEAKRAAWIREAGDYIPEHGDNVLFRGPKAGDTAEAFNQLARALAALAFQPGGVTFGGRHWCTDHTACVAAERAAEDG